MIVICRVGYISRFEDMFNFIMRVVWELIKLHRF
jgi:hypothetical protein